MINDKIIVGRSLSCLLYCWRTQSRCIIKDPEYIHRFDKRYEGYDFSFINATNAKELWANLSFAMSFTSLLLFPNRVQTIREEESGVTIITKGNGRVFLNNNEVSTFDKETKEFGVFDFFNAKDVRPNPIIRLEDESRFVYQLDFHSYGSSSKGLIAASKMTQEEVLDPDLGQGIAKLKVERMLNSNGFTGCLSRRYKGKDYYKRPKIEFHKRVLTPLFESQYDFETIYNMKQKEGEAWKTIERLRVR